MEGLGQQLFEQLTDANAAAMKHVRIGRQQMALEITRILNTETNNGRAIALILSLCNREAK